MTLILPNGESFALGVTGYEYRPATSYETTPRLVLEIEIEGILAEAIVDTGGVYLFCNPEIARRSCRTCATAGGTAAATAAERPAPISKVVPSTP
jgi:hypothetical protein